MEQLPLPLGPFPEKKTRLKKPKCPYCKQRMGKSETILVWAEFRDYLVENKTRVAVEMLRGQIANPKGISLENHPDLEWALQAEADFHGLKPEELAIQILDSFFLGAFDLRHRRGKKLDAESFAE